MPRTSTSSPSLNDIRAKLDARLASREADEERLEELKRENARAIRGAEQVRRILQRA
jgi:hypothetical protein